VGATWFNGAGKSSVKDSLDELSALAATAGLFVIGRTHQQLSEPHAATLIGRGKVAEIKLSATEQGANTVIFDEELTPAQQRNLENIFGEKI